MGKRKQSANIDSSSNDNGAKKTISWIGIDEILEQDWGKPSNFFSLDDSSILKREDFERQLKETKERSDFVLSEAERSLNKAVEIQLKIEENYSSVKNMLEEVKNMLEEVKIQKAAIESFKEQMSNIITGVIAVIWIFTIGLAWDFFKVRSDDYRAHNEKYMHSLNKITQFESKISEIQNNQKKVEQWIDDKISAEINKRIVEFWMKDKQIKFIE